MRVTKSELDVYSRFINGLQDSAKSYVATQLKAYLILHPNESLDEFIAYAQKVVNQALKVYGGLSANKAAQVYDQTSSTLGVNAAPAKPVNKWSEKYTNRNTSFEIRQAYFGNTSIQEMLNKVSMPAYMQPLRAANNTMSENADRDYEKGMRWARVPTGDTTCGFCIMLASQGFVYSSKKSAGYKDLGSNTFHDNCDCKVVVGNDETDVEGYEQKEYLDAYTEARKQIEQTAQDEWWSMSQEERDKWKTPGKGAYDHYLRNQIANQMTKNLKASQVD